MSEIETWAIAFVTKLDPSFANLNDNQKLKENLFTSGRLDSLDLMNFLLDAEGQFGFVFTPEAFQDRRLQTILGLAEVIRELKGTA